MRLVLGRKPIPSDRAGLAQLNAARVGPEAIVGHSLEPGDRIEVEYLVGVVVKVTRLPTL